MTKKITKSLPLAVIVPYTISFKALSIQKEKKKKGPGALTMYYGTMQTGKVGRNGASGAGRAIVTASALLALALVALVAVNSAPRR
jgi:hypothetical protein